MLTIEAKTKNIEAWLNWATNITTKINNARVQEVSIESALQLGKDIAVALCPVKTGHLRDSINWLLTGRDTGELRADASYAGEVNFGTPARPERPFFTIAVVEVMRQFPQVARENMEELLHGVDPKSKKLSSSGVPLGRLGHAKTAKKGAVRHKYISKYVSRSGRTKYIYARDQPGTKTPIGKRRSKHQKKLGFKV